MENLKGYDMMETQSLSGLHIFGLLVQERLDFVKRLSLEDVIAAPGFFLA